MSRRDTLQDYESRRDEWNAQERKTLLRKPVFVDVSDLAREHVTCRGPFGACDCAKDVKGQDGK
jgi:hypothetical protein